MRGTARRRGRRHSGVIGLRLWYGYLAERLCAAGAVTASKRLVRRWEAGEISEPRPVYARALFTVTGLTTGELGFSAARVPGVDIVEDAQDGRGGRTVAAGRGRPGPADPAGQPAVSGGSHTGVWLSRYEYHSSSREATLADERYVVLLQTGDRLTVRSLTGSAPSVVTMDLTVDRSLVTGTWKEHTDPAGFYRGAVYHGAVQLVVGPTGHRMVGRWVGFGKDGEVNTGPWTLRLVDRSTSKATLARYNRPPAEAGEEGARS